MEQSIFTVARQCLLEPGVEATLVLTEQTVRYSRNTPLNLANIEPVDCNLKPVFPPQPVLIDPRDLPRRGLGTQAGRTALIHAIAHIEYNAIHLAWDAIYRFRDLPQEFYRDWMKVAVEECRHFRLLRQRLYKLGYDYGDFDAHDGLWRVAYNTRHDPLVRMALVPRVLEARGLDVTPGMIKNLASVNDHESADILQIIYDEEIGHVQIGTRWFRHLCADRGLEPEQAFYRIVDEYYSDGLRGPYNEAARLQAGFTETELDWLNQGLKKQNE